MAQRTRARELHRPAAVRRAALLSVIVFLAAVVAGCSLTPTPRQWDFKLIADEPAIGDSFGGAVDIDGPSAIVGASRDDVSGEGGTSGGNEGTAYVFSRTQDGWHRTARLSASDPGEFRDFGYTVAIHGDVVVVGSPTVIVENPAVEAVYVFERVDNTWTETQKLTPVDWEPNDGFGRALAISDGYIFVGGSGVVHVYEQTLGSWAEATRLQPEDPAYGQNFGNSIDTDDGLLVVGADNDSQTGTQQGAAYVFSHASGFWSQDAKLSLPNAPDYLQLGRSVSVSGGRAVLGRGVSGDPDEPGTAYVFEKQGESWVYTATLTSESSVAGISFGVEVAVEGDVALVGDPADAVYVFRRNPDTTWTEVNALRANDGYSGNFGQAVAASDGNILVGAAGADTSEQRTGAAYLFETW